jgi:hypothetical protein
MWYPPHLNTVRAFVLQFASHSGFDFSGGQTLAGRRCDRSSQLNHAWRFYTVRQVYVVRRVARCMLYAMPGGTLHVVRHARWHVACCTPCQVARCMLYAMPGGRLCTRCDR